MGRRLSKRHNHWFWKRFVCHNYGCFLNQEMVCFDHLWVWDSDFVYISWQKNTNQTNQPWVSMQTAAYEQATSIEEASCFQNLTRYQESVPFEMLVCFCFEQLIHVCHNENWCLNPLAVQCRQVCSKKRRAPHCLQPAQRDLECHLTYWLSGASVQGLHIG